jgi:predicted nucleotidyltransferase
VIELEKAKKEIVSKIQFEVDKKIALKRGYRKKAKVLLEKLSRAVCRPFFQSDVLVKQYDGVGSLGSDEVGRDVQDGARKYVEILKNRGIKIRTVIALGSRAKGSWKPESDVDVTIIADNLPSEALNPISKRFLALKLRVLLSDRPICMGIEPSGCCSRPEFLKRLHDFDIQTLDAVLYGQVVYDDGFWETALEEFSVIAERYELAPLLLKRILAPA